MPTDAEMVAISRRALTALGNGDHGPALSALDDRVRVRASGPLWSRRYRGAEELLRAYDEAKRRFRNPKLSICSVRADEDGSVLVAGRIAGTLPGDGRLAAELRGVLWFREGKVQRVYLRTRRHELRGRKGRGAGRRRKAEPG